MRVWVAIIIDAAAILLFAVIGRLSHAESASPAGVFLTAWPFLTGALVGWLVGRVWHHPGTFRGALPVWPATVIIGMLLRAATGAGVQLSFVIVATIVLGIFLLGWRAVAQVATRRRPALNP